MKTSFSGIILLLSAAAAVNYALRAVPLLLLRRRLSNPRLAALLRYMPYALLSAMVIPGVFGSTGTVSSAAIGFTVAFALSFFNGGLTLVAAAACAAVYAAEALLH